MWESVSWLQVRITRLTNARACAIDADTGITQSSQWNSMTLEKEQEDRDREAEQIQNHPLLQPDPHLSYSFISADGQKLWDHSLSTDRFFRDVQGFEIQEYRCRDPEVTMTDQTSLALQVSSRIWGASDI